MPREHVEFIQSQGLPWVPMGADSARPGCAIRTMSQDPDSLASSTLIRYPAGWNMADAHQLACDEEFFVLEGDLRIGTNHYGPGDYAYLPAGYPRRDMRSAIGAVVLTFFEAAAINRALAHHPAAFNSDKLIEHCPSAQMGWSGATEPVVAGPKVGRKGLRPDTPEGERSWILSMQGSPAHPIEVNGVEQHPCVEEMFLLKGSFHMPNGVMYAGAYFWRPPMIHHGPMGSRESFIAFFRAKEGSFTTQWSRRGAAVLWNQPYEPVIPADLEIATVTPADCQKPF